MLDIHVMQSMATLGYILAGLGLISCIAAYLAVPKIIKIVFNNEDEE